MSNIKTTTPISKSNQKPINVSLEKTSSGKKMVQARLPFKIIPSVSSPGDTMTVVLDDISDVPTTNREIEMLNDSRKRKLSYNSDEDKLTEDNQIKRRSGSKENLDVSNKRQKSGEGDTEHVIILDDSDNSNNAHSSSITKINKERNVPKTTPKVVKNKGAGTPQSADRKQKSEEKCNSNSATKIKIKLPLKCSSSKRRKSGRKSVTLDTSIKSGKLKDQTMDSSDDMEIIADTLNPQKRHKLQHEQEENENSISAKGTIEVENHSNKEFDEQLERSKIYIEDEKNKGNLKLKENSDVVILSDIDKDSGGEDNGTEVPMNSSDSSELTQCVSDAKDQLSKNDLNGSLSNTTGSTPKQKKILTPKQIKLDEQRRRAREEKERKLQELKLQKQKEKEEKDLAKKHDREEKEKLKRIEREEKDEQKRKEREEKERKRLAEVEAKNEEKRKRIEAKEEEQRKKDEERRRREQEKEDAHIKKKKAAEAFTKFFVPKSLSSTNKLNHVPVVGPDGSEGSLAFRPFQLRNDMKLAPIFRKDFSEEDRSKLDTYLPSTDIEVSENRYEVDVPKSRLYLSELANGKIIPEKWRRASIEIKNDLDEDICVIDELERAGQEIVEDTHGPLEHYRTKFYKFSENRRPPYYGTWRKRSSVITPRRPFVKDQQFFDYEIDSDLEWEEEEPGESLDGSDDDKEKESEDDDYEVDNEWFVPHGHLSDEEMQNEDEFGMGNDNDNNREAQKAKLKILQQQFAQEMKKKTEKIKPRLMGCIWVDENGNHPDICPKIIWDTLGMSSMLYTGELIVNEQEISEKSEPNSPNTNVEKIVDKLKPLVLSEKLEKDLIRLVHGNQHAKTFLIKEFIAYIEATEESIRNGDAKGPLKCTVREKIEDFAEWQITETKNMKNKIKKKLCWVVSDEVLKKMDLTHLGLHNTWDYTLQPKFMQTENQPKAEIDDNLENKKNSIDDTPTKNLNSSNSKKKTLNGKNKEEGIKKFTKPSKSDKTKLQTMVKDGFFAVADPSNKSEESANVNLNSSGKIDSNPNVAPKVNTNKKRVPLLMSVPRGQQFSLKTKSAVISQFLQKNLDEKSSESKDKIKSNSTNSNSNEDVIILE